MSALERPPMAGRASVSPEGAADTDVEALRPVLRRSIGARVPDRQVAEDLVQETLTRVLAAQDRIEPGMLKAYALATAGNLVASLWKERDRHRRNQHRVVDLRPVETPEEPLLAEEERAAVAEALSRLPDRDRSLLLAHEVSGEGTRALADDVGSTPGAVAAQLSRTRARLRVEYLLVRENAEPPTDLCRPVLLALSAADRRRQRELDAGRHLLECQLCTRLSAELLRRGQRDEDRLRIVIGSDADIVKVRQAARALAERAGFGRTDQTVIATAVSEVARNIVRFADAGETTVEVVHRPRRGLQVTARDTGPGIEDVDRALTDGYSTYRGLGLGLPGTRRLMDEFSLESEPGRGTTVTMTKWLPGG